MVPRPGGHQQSATNNLRKTLTAFETSQTRRRRRSAHRGFGALALLVTVLLALTPAHAQVPAALVEDVKSSSTNVQFMDYLITGQVIKLQARETLVLSYLKSCHYETITGGTVIVGSERSDVVGGKVVRNKVPCDGGRMQLTFELANSSAASSYRDRAPIKPDATIFAVMPMFEVDGGRKLIIERLDRIEERLEFEIGNNLIREKFFDLTTVNKGLSRSAIYRATLGNYHITFQVHAQAKRGKVPVISRLLRFPSQS